MLHDNYNCGPDYFQQSTFLQFKTCGVVLMWVYCRAHRDTVCVLVQTRPKWNWQLIFAIVHKVASSSGPHPCFMLSCQADEVGGWVVGVKTGCCFLPTGSHLSYMGKLEDRKWQYCVSYWDGWMREKRLQDFISNKKYRGVFFIIIKSY